MLQGSISNSYSGTELNRHGPFGPQDFKSCVSTSSTTRVNTCLIFFKL